MYALKELPLQAKPLDSPPPDSPDAFEAFMADMLDIPVHVERNMRRRSAVTP